MSAAEAASAPPCMMPTGRPMRTGGRSISPLRQRWPPKACSTNSPAGSIFERSAPPKRPDFGPDERRIGGARVIVEMIGRFQAEALKIGDDDVRRAGERDEPIETIRGVEVEADAAFAHIEGEPERD